MAEENNNQNNTLKGIAQDIKKIAFSVDGLGTAVVTAARTAVEDIRSIIHPSSSISESIEKQREENLREDEIEALKGQLKEAREQTRIMRGQAWYFIGTLIVVALSFIIDIILRLRGL